MQVLQVMQAMQVLQVMQILQAKGHKKTVGATNGFKIANEEGYYFFLCLIILSFFFLLCVAILCFFLFLPQGTAELLISPKAGEICNYGVHYRDFESRRSIAVGAFFYFYICYMISMLVIN